VVHQAGSSEVAALGNSPTTYGYNSPDCPVSQRSAGPTVGRAIYAGHVAEPTARRGHRTCPVRQRLSGGQRSAAPFKERNRASDCPVHQSTEGKISLPDLLSTTPSCLGAIKGPLGAWRRISSIPTTFLSTKTSIPRIWFIVIASRALVEL
jgi:hypothetical protein